MTDWALQLAPVFLGLGIAFLVYGIVYHVAINMGHWREIREDDNDGQVILSGRKRFERKKELRPGMPAQGEPTGRARARGS